MKRFADLYAELDASTSTNDKVAALQRYLGAAPQADAAWAVHLLCGGKPRQVMRTTELRALACEVAAVPDWLFEECYQTVGDLAETIAALLPAAGASSELGLADWMTQRVLPLREVTAEQRAERLRAWWDELDRLQRFLLIKLMGGGFRVGVSRLLVQRALAAYAGLEPALIAQRMMGRNDARTMPTEQTLRELLEPADAPNAERPQTGGQPYPFFLAHALAVEHSGDASAATLATLGAPDDWQVEWKYDGIRAQWVSRLDKQGRAMAWLWSRGEELINAQFPDVLRALAAWPVGTVLDGELLLWPADAAQPMPFAALQRRLGRKTLGPKLLSELPAVFIAYDLLEADGVDLRTQPQAERRKRLQAMHQRLGGCRLAPLLHADSWAAYAQLQQSAREQGVEGLMLKAVDSTYGSGRTRSSGLWWKWKTQPWSVDGVLIYAQAGHGRRAALYTDYTFALWNRPPRDAAEAQACAQSIADGNKAPADPQALQLVPFAKAYSGLSDAEIRAVDAEIRRHTVNKFGPVRTVRPTLVFEIAFEGISLSSRHRSGVALRFPRMLRRRDDKPLHEAGTLPELRSLLGPGAVPAPASLAMTPGPGE